MSNDLLRSFVQQDIKKEDVESADVGGGGGFTRGLTTLYDIRPLYSVFAKGLECDEKFYKDNGLDFFMVRKRANSTTVYFEDRESGKLAKELVDPSSTYSEPNHVWIFDGDISRVKRWNSDEKSPEEVYQYGLFNEVPLLTLGGNAKSRGHKYNLVTVPSYVQAMAIAFGLIDREVFDFNEFASNEESVQNALAMELLGATHYETAAKFQDREEDARLIQARKQLWALLGADTSIEGYWKGRKPGDYGIPSYTGGESDKPITLILSRLILPHKSWLTLAMAWDPMRSAKPEKESIYERIPVITEFFKSEEEAAGDSDVVYPTPPKGWESQSPTDIIETVRDFLKDVKILTADNGFRLEVTPPKFNAQVKDLKWNELGMSKEDLLAWRDFINR